MEPRARGETAPLPRRRGADVGLAGIAAIALYAIARSLTRPPADATLVAVLLPAIFVLGRALGTRRDSAVATLTWLMFPALSLLWLADASSLAALLIFVVVSVRAWSLYPGDGRPFRRVLFVAITAAAPLAILGAHDTLAVAGHGPRLWLSLRSGSLLFRGEQSLDRNSPPLRLDTHGPLRGVVLISAVANAADLVDGTPIAELRRSGRVVATVVIGDHTAEWSWDRADLAGHKGHRRARVFTTRFERDERGQVFPARIYGATLPFSDQPGQLELAVTAPPPVVLVVHELRTLRW